jgi:hypothetical protein
MHIAHAGRWACNNGSTIGVTATIHSSGALRTIQGDAIREINAAWHNAYASAATHWPSDVLQGVSPGAALAYDAIGNGAAPHSYWHDEYPSRVRIDASRVTPVANEIRPANVAVKYLIRALQ